MTTFNKSRLFFAFIAFIVTIPILTSCKKEKSILGFWQQAHDYVTITDSEGYNTYKNITDSAVTLCFLDNDTVLLSYGKEHPLLSTPPSQLNDSLRSVIASLPNNLSRDSIPYTITDDELTIGTQTYQLEKLTYRWLVITTSDSIDGQKANRVISFIKHRK